MNETTTPVADQVVVIPEANMWKVEEFFKKLATRAKRTKKAPPCYIEVSRETVQVKASTICLEIKGDPMVPRVFVTLQVAGNRPHIPGFTFIGTIEHGEEINILKAAPGQEMPEKYRQVKTACDHCKKNRRRNNTFVMQEDATGEYKQIARNCLADYLGNAADVKDMLNQFMWWSEAIELLVECEGYCGLGGGRRSHENITVYLRIVACMVRKFGWLGRKVARDNGTLMMATASRAWDIMYPPVNPDAAERAELEKVEFEDCDLELVINAMEWIRSRPEAERFGYIGNLYGACFSDSFLIDNDGLVASLVGAAYPKAMGKERKREEKPEKPVSQYVGKVGEKLKDLDLTVKVMRFRENFTETGYSTFCVFEDPEGNVLLWPASRDLEDFFCVGDVVTLDGTVKEHKLNSHEKFGDTKQTWLTRCKITEVISQEEADLRKRVYAQTPETAA